MNICYEVFHVDGINEDRDEVARIAHKNLSKGYSRLDSPTINLIDKDYKKDIPNVVVKRPMKSGEIGIYASNFIAWQKFLNSSYDALLIVEDDIFISSNFVEKINLYTRKMPQDWDVLFIYGNTISLLKYNNNKFYDKDIHSIGHPFISKMFLRNLSAGCYLVSRSGAKKLVEHSTNNFTDAVDAILYSLKELNKYCLNPGIYYPCSLVFTKSTIQNGSKLYE